MQRRFIYQFTYLTLVLLLLFLQGCHTSQPTLKRLHSDDIILALGDSLTFGTGATPNTSYPADLKQLLTLDVINAGIPGEETAGTLQRLASVLEQYHPQLVILCIGGNDLIRRRPIPTIKANIKEMIRIIQANGIQVILISVPEPSIALKVPTLYQELGQEFHIPVENDILATLLKQPQLKSDFIHLNAAGYQAFAEAIYALLKETKAIKMTK